MNIIVLPNSREAAALGQLIRDGYAITSVRRGGRSVNVAHRVRSNVVPLRRSVVEQIFDFARRPL